MDYIPYLESQYQSGVKLIHVTKHLMGLFKGISGAKEIRRFLTRIDLSDDPIENFKQLASGFSE